MGLASMPEEASMLEVYGTVGRLRCAIWNSAGTIDTPSSVAPLIWDLGHPPVRRDPVSDVGCKTKARDGGARTPLTGMRARDER